MSVDSGAFRYVLRALRRVQELTTDELARRAGLCGSTVRHLERGTRTPSYDTACSLADVLGIGVDGFREGPNQKPVEGPALRDARLAALQRWHREESNARRLAGAAGRPVDQVQAPKRQPYRYCVYCEQYHPPELSACPAELRARGLIDQQPAAAELVEQPAQAAELVEDLGQAAELVEPAAIPFDGGDLAGQYGPPAEQLPPGELTRQLLQAKAELHPLDPGDRKAFHQARRRALAGGKDGMDAAAAGYAAVRRHRELTRSGGKRPGRIAQDRPSRSRPTQGTAEKGAQGAGRNRPNKPGPDRVE